MKKIATALLGATLLSAPAGASDLFGSTKDPVTTGPTSSGGVVNWSGFYVGAQVGNSFAIIGDEDGQGGISVDGIFGGGRIGYDVARGRYLFGIFGEYNWSGAELELGGDSILEKDHDWTAGARAGVVVAPRTLFYILGGFTQADFSSGGDTETFDGWTAGGGIEVAVATNITLGVEASHTWYDEEEVFGPDISLDDTRIMAVARFKVNGL